MNSGVTIIFTFTLWQTIRLITYKFTSTDNVFTSLFAPIYTSDCCFLTMALLVQMALLVHNVN